MCSEYLAAVSQLRMCVVSSPGTGGSSGRRAAMVHSQDAFHQLYLHTLQVRTSRGEANLSHKGGPGLNKHTWKDQLTSVHLLDPSALVSGFSQLIFHTTFSLPHQMFSLQEPDFGKASVLKTNQSVGGCSVPCVSSQHVISYTSNLLMNQNSSCRLPSIRLDRPRFVMTASCPNTVRVKEHFKVKYVLLNNLQDFLAVRLVWTPDGQFVLSCTGPFQVKYDMMKKKTRHMNDGIGPHYYGVAMDPKLQKDVSRQQQDVSQL